MSLQVQDPQNRRHARTFLPLFLQLKLDSIEHSVDVLMQARAALLKGLARASEDFFFWKLPPLHALASTKVNPRAFFAMADSLSTEELRHVVFGVMKGLITSRYVGGK